PMRAGSPPATRHCEASAEPRAFSARHGQGGRVERSGSRAGDAKPGLRHARRGCEWRNCYAEASPGAELAGNLNGDQIRQPPGSRQTPNLTGEDMAEIKGADLLAKS